MNERTFEPTPRRLAELRRRGDVPMSAEVTSGLTLLAAVYLLAARLASLSSMLQELMRASFKSLSNPDLSANSLESGGLVVVHALAGAWLPFMLTIMAIGIIVSLVQTRGLIAMHRLLPDVKRLNPVSGLGRIFSKQGLFETGKGLAKMAILAVVLYGGARVAIIQLAVASQAGLVPGIASLTGSLNQMAHQAAMFLLLAAGLDVIFRQRQYQQRSKMTRQEVTEDMKNAEGQPILRAKIREMQRRLGRRRMMQQLARADVIVTNPTHLAIALRYDAKKMAAPVVVAKGQGLIAEQIMRKAREYGIPLVENIPLAHALIKIELGAAIPSTLYQAVAEVLAFVYRVRRHGAGYAGQGATQ
jgi:flagellar biosynthetic protein FlhB